MTGGIIVNMSFFGGDPLSKSKNKASIEAGLLLGVYQSW